MSKRNFSFNLRKRWQQLKGRNFNKETIALIAFVACLSILFLAFLPAAGDFEGNLIVEELSFTYDKDNSSDQLLLNSIRGIKKIEIGGQHQQTLTLSGKFTSQIQPEINQLETLQINLNQPESRLIIEASDRQKSQLELKQLRLQPGITVNNLSYNPSLQQLSLSLQSQEKSNQGNLLELSLGENPLKITLENYRLRNLKSANNNEGDYLEFTFTPTLTELKTKLNLTSDKSSPLYIDLPEPSKVNSQEWFWGNIAVKKVKFFRPLKTANIPDEIPFSTILQGKIRLEDQTLDIEANQFLIPGKPGIQTIKHLQIQTKKPQGLEVLLRGQAAKLEVGIDRDFPVNSLQTNILNRYFSREAITTLLAFCAAVIGAILPQLLTSKNP
jgi:hypothetical protein